MKTDGGAGFLIIAGTLFLCGSAFGQDCGGMVNVNGICIPPDQESSPLYDTYGGGYEYHAPANLPSPRWRDSWGGMAMDEQNGISGIVAELSSKRKAIKAAISECKLRGGENCEIVATYKNQCLVVVSSGNKSQIVNAATIERATEIATHDCEADGSTDCHLYYSGCSVAKRVR